MPSNGNDTPHKTEWPEARCFVPPDIHERLKTAARRRGASMDLVIREAILYGLAQAERPIVGTGAGSGTGAR